jgi:uncharacterized protein (TIGR03118 family)
MDETSESVPIAGRQFATFDVRNRWRSEEASMRNNSIIPCRPLATYGVDLKQVISMLIAPALLGCTLMLGASTAFAQYKQKNLVSDKTGMALRTDPNLLDAWGMAELPDGGFIVADALSGFVTFYARSGKTLRPPVTVPAAPSLPPGTPGSPAGLVSNPTSEFVISKNGKSAPALYLFSTLDGLICGWNPTVDPDNAIIVVDNSTLTPFPASYDDLTMTRNKYGQMVIYAVDSGVSATQSNNDVEIYDGNFNLLNRFIDSSAPSDMTAYSARIVNGKVYVTYAGFTPQAGGVVDIFDTEGNMLRRFAANSSSGPLQAPWEVILAPANFGWASHQLLIGEVDSGNISVFNPTTGAFLGQLTDAHGKPIVIDGVWALIFARRERGERSPQLFFAAGCAFPPSYSPSLFGLITVTDGDDGKKQEAGSLSLPLAQPKSRISPREN